MTNHMQAPISPDAKKKKPALPSLLSNIRNAQAAVGRAVDDLHDRETRPLVGGGGSGGGRMPASVNNPQLHRTPHSTFSSTLQNFSERFGSQWRKRSDRRKKGRGVTVVPQSFFIAVGCFFVAFPVFFVVYVLARHAVFGDEGNNSGTQAHIHEVPSAFSNGMAFESGKELLERNKIDPPASGIIGARDIAEKKSSSNEGLEIYEKIMEEEDPPESIKSATRDAEPEVSHNLRSDTTNKTTGVISDEGQAMKDSISKTKIDGSIIENGTKNAHDVSGEGDGSTIVKKEFKSSKDPKENEKDKPKRSAKASLTSDLLSTGLMKESAKSTSLDQVKEKGGVEKETYHKNLRGSQDKDE